MPEQAPSHEVSTGFIDLLPAGTPRLRYGLQLANLALGTLDPERTEALLADANGYVRIVHECSAEDGTITARYEPTAEGMAVIERYAWPIRVKAVKEQLAERLGIHPEQTSLLDG